MSRRIDYYHFLISPWSYLAVRRFNALRRASEVTVAYKPIDVMTTFSEMGGTPPAKRHPSRQRLRMDELRRWSRHLDVPINLEPAHFPTDQSLAARVVYAAGGADADPLAANLSDAFLSAVWAEERDIADEAVVRAIVDDQGLDGATLLERARSEAMETLYRDTTAEAHGRDVFGSPTWVLEGENFWGQDRLGFLEAALGD